MFIINLLGLLFTTNLPLAILHEQSVLLRPKIIHSDAELTQMQTYAIKDLFVVLSSFTGDPNSGRLLYNIVSRWNCFEYKVFTIMD